MKDFNDIFSSIYLLIHGLKYKIHKLELHWI